jgi:hypothetical protein
MVSTAEFFDIEKIEQLRKLNGRELDGYDNFSWHVALFEDGALSGVARLYRFDGGVMLDNPVLYKKNFSHSEVLFKTLMLKAVSSGFKNVYAFDDNGFITEFERYRDNIIKADISHIKKLLCGGCNNC